MNTVFIRFLFVLVLTTLSNYTFSQGACGFGPGKGCTGTVYDNAFVNSDNNAATIEYDNFVSTFHSSIVRNYQGSFLVWGEQISNDGVTSVLSPIEINNVNFPNLASHEVYKAAAGSNFIDERQFFVLTSNGLYAWGDEDGVVANAITNSAVFQKINTAAISNANSFGLPSTITPAEVKMMVASIANSLNGTLMITTCSGQVWVLSQLGNLRGNNNTGNATTWSRVETGAGVFLDNIVAARVSGSSAIAIRSDGTLWTWGLGTYLGNNTASATRNRATQMTAPPGTPKMIGITADATDPVAYYVLMTNGNLYSLGFNGSRQLGDFTVTERRAWVQPRYNAAAPGGTVMNNILWVAPSESDGRYPAANVINSDSILYAFGANDTRMIGRGAGADADPGIPDGLNATTKITGVVTGGHTTMVTTKCELNFGYVGHRIRGSMGNGSSANITENSYNFATAQVPVCGTAFSSVAIIPSVTGPGGNYCVGQLYDITVVPSGGTLTSGAGDPINLFGNSTIGYQLQFTGLGTATLTYQLPTNSCGIAPIPATISVQSEFCQSDLSVVKTVNNSNPTIGSNVIFTIVASNNGPSDNIDVVVNDLLPSGYSYVSHTVSNGVYNNSTGIWNIGALVNGGSATLSVTAQVQSSGIYLNTASITGDLTDPSNVNNSSSVSVCALTLAVSSLTNVLCFGNNTGSATATTAGGTGSVTYLWSNGQTNATATGLTAGTYTVTATDANGCVSSTGATVTEPAAALVTSISGQTNVLCFGNNTGSATATTSGGTGSVTYLWSNGQTNATATGLTAGTYTVTATDANGCASSTGATITEPAAALVASISGQTNVLCFGNNTGSATATTAGGTGSVTYLWSNAQTNATATGLTAGTYIFTATDANGCASSTGATITEPAAALVASMSGQTNILCFGNNTGSATATTAGGTGSVTYLWSNAQTNATATGLTAGTYSVTATDANGCASSTGVTITQPTAVLNVTLSATTNEFCTTLGTASINVSGGVSPYIYNWSGSASSQTSSSVTGLTAGNYTVTATDANACSSTLLVTIGLTNCPPDAVNDAVNTNEDNPLTFNPISNDNDLNGPLDTSTLVIVFGPSNGTATVNPLTGEITYTPNLNFNGTDTLIYQICDLGTPVLCDTAIVVITVNAVNDGPIANDDTNTTNEDNSVSGTVATNDSDVDGPSINITQVSGPSNGTIVLNIDGTYTYTPSLNFNGIDTVVYSFCDGGTPNLCDTAILVITVNAVNDGPIANDDTNTTDEDNAVSGTVATNDSDVDGPSINITQVSGPSNGTIVLNIDGTYTYTPSLNFNGTDTVVYSYCDGGTPNLCDTAILVITVNAVNDGPIANDDTNTTNEDNSVSGTVATNDSDVDGPSINITQVSGPSNGTIVLNIDGTYTYTPSLNFNGTDTVVYSYCDGGTPNLCDTAILVITVNAVNDGPIANDDTNTTNEDNSVSGTVATNDSDVDGPSINITQVSGPSNGTIVLNIDGTYTYTPNLNFNGSDTLVYSYCDGGTPNLCDTAILVITVNAVNDTIIAVNDAATTNEDVAVDIFVLSNDFDLDGNIDSTSVTIITNPTNGVVTVDPVTGTVTYTPNPGYNGVDFFVYQVCDNGTPLPGLCDQAAVVITINPVNDEPIANPDISTTNEDSPVVIDVISNDTDSDGNIDPTTVNVISGPNNGIVVVDSITGEITYTPNTNFNGSDTLVYVVCDNGTPLPALCDTAVVIINVNPINDSIIANPDVVSTNEDTSVVISILGNDTDLDGNIDSSTVSVITNPTNGTVVYDPVTGTITYTPNIGFNGIDSFVYIVCDNGTPLPVTCDTAIVVINVAPCLTLPFADCDGDGSTNADEAANGTDPSDPCSYNASSVTLPQDANWLDLDCDGDGVINGTELADSTNPQDPCSYDSSSITLVQGGDWNNADCDGDGVTNGTEITDGTDPNDPCSTELSSVTLTPGGAWNNADCDGDGVINGTEILDGTGPYDPCSYFIVSVTESQGGIWTGTDCDGDGVINSTEVSDGTNPFDPCSLIITSQTVNPDSIWNSADCDNDGFTNGVEILEGSNPLDSCSPIACDLNIPEGFSPNGDGTNDTYVIRAIERYPNNNIKIFNRWGNIVYEADAYLNQWDGRSNRGLRLGEELPSGVYFIILDLGEGGNPYKGNVYLNREN